MNICFTLQPITQNSGGKLQKHDKGIMLFVLFPVYYVSSQSSIH